MAIKPIRIAIVEDETLFAIALGAWLARIPDFKIEGHAGANVGAGICAWKPVRISFCWMSKCPTETD